MKLNPKQLKAVRWSARLTALALLALGLPFYFGYGNPLPFINPDYSLAENVGLILLPLVFIGLALGWKYEKVGGCLVVLPLTIGLVLALSTGEGFPMNLLIALIPGALYLVAGYQSKKNRMPLGE
ncbi:hypothetical protein JXA05_03705 [Candidatus Peregrinibacteria bacterium]|nr:hypothetical protein [Candidatus Peregrinibacteria bacterium]